MAVNRYAPSIEWTYEGGTYNFMHILNVDYGFATDEQYQIMADKAEASFKRHLLLEMLGYLKVLEYDRGYDGLYYMIRIRAK